MSIAPSGFCRGPVRSGQSHLQTSHFFLGYYSVEPKPKYPACSQATNLSEPTGSTTSFGVRRSALDCQFYESWGIAALWI